LLSKYIADRVAKNPCIRLDQIIPYNKTASSLSFDDKCHNVLQDRLCVSKRSPRHFYNIELHTESKVANNQRKRGMRTAFCTSGTILDVCIHEIVAAKILPGFEEHYNEHIVPILMEQKLKVTSNSSVFCIEDVKVPESLLQEAEFAEILAFQRKQEAATIKKMEQSQNVILKLQNAVHVLTERLEAPRLCTSRDLLSVHK
jgi:hypothetical protein